jgi:hypothetical protein
MFSEIEQLRINLMINGSNMSDFGLSIPSTGVLQFDMFGAYNTLCGQLDKYILHWGIGLIIFYAIMSWLVWLFLEYGYKYIKYSDGEFKCYKFFIFKMDFTKYDLRIWENRIHWQLFFMDKMIKIFIGYVIVVVYLLYAR